MEIEEKLVCSSLCHCEGEARGNLVHKSTRLLRRYAPRNDSCSLH